MNKRPFLYWLLIFICILVGTAICWHFGLVEKIAKSDISTLSFWIYGLFIVMSISIGVCTWRRNPALVKFGWFMHDALLTLGLIGTIVGLIYAVDVAIGSLSADASTVQLKSTIMHMAIGLGTAFFTTAAGMSCALILRLQLFNLEEKACIPIEL